MIPRLTKNKLSKLIDLRKSPEYIAGVKKIVYQEFEKARLKLIAEFNRHPVTREIEGGPNASNLSDTLGGYGNLFSFIGFEVNSKPTNAIRSKLNDARLANVNFDRRGLFNVVALYPQPEEIFRVTPLPWAEGRSWAEGIEKGLSGFGMYLNKSYDGSKSGKGLQSDSKVRSGKFRNTSYISKLIRDFERDLNLINSTKLL